MLTATLLFFISLCIGVHFWNRQLESQLLVHSPPIYRCCKLSEKINVHGLPKMKAVCFHFHHPDHRCSKFTSRQMESFSRDCKDNDVFFISVLESRTIISTRGKEDVIDIDTASIRGQLCGIYFYPSE